MELSLETRTVADRTVLEVGGEIDVYTAPRLRERLLELVAEGTRYIVVNMERVEFLDSTGLGVLVGGLKRIRAQGGSLVLVCSQERILKIFRITGLERVFQIFSSVDEAVVGLADSSGSGAMTSGDDAAADASGAAPTGSAGDGSQGGDDRAGSTAERSAPAAGDPDTGTPRSASTDGGAQPTAGS